MLGGRGWQTPGVCHEILGVDFCWFFVDFCWFLLIFVDFLLIFCLGGGAWQTPGVCHEILGVDFCWFFVDFCWFFVDFVDFCWFFVDFWGGMGWQMKSLELIFVDFCWFFVDIFWGGEGLPDPRGSAMKTPGVCESLPPLSVTKERTKWNTSLSLSSLLSILSSLLPIDYKKSTKTRKRPNNTNINKTTRSININQNGCNPPLMCWRYRHTGCCLDMP